MSISDPFTGVPAVRPADRAAQDELLRLVADGLASAGLDVHQPDGQEESLVITRLGARCVLTIGDYGFAEWEYHPRSPADADPALTADLATALLTGRFGPQPRLGTGHQRERVTFKGLVGLELKARGLDVELAVYSDEAVFDTFAEIVATVPGPADDGQVCVADDGGLTWTRDYCAGIIATPAPGTFGQTAAPSSIASSLVETVTRAVAYLHPAEASRDGHV